MGSSQLTIPLHENVAGEATKIPESSRTLEHSI